MENYNAGFDLPDPRDLRAEQVLDMSWDIPERVILDQTEPLNQGKIWACTVFGSSGALFETLASYIKSIDWDYVQPYDPWNVWDKAKQRWASDTKGWIMQWALQLIKDLKHSEWYLLVAPAFNTDPTPLKKSIANWYAIVTWSSKWDWVAIKKTWIYSEQKNPAWHIWQINWYDDNYEFPGWEKWWFHSPNSWWGSTAFWIPYSMISKMYSTYIQASRTDKDAIDNYKSQKMRNYTENAKKRGIWNGSEGERIATEEEIRIMLQRALNILGARSRDYWSQTFQDRVIRWKDLVKIWNEKDGKKMATNWELALMFTRAALRNQDITSLTLTRYQVAAIIARDFIPNP